MKSLISGFVQSVLGLGAGLFALLSTMTTLMGGYEVSFAFIAIVLGLGGLGITNLYFGSQTISRALTNT